MNINFANCRSELRFSKTVQDTRKPNRTDTSGGKKSQIEGFSSVSVFASGVTGSFRFHCFPAREIEFLPRAREREGGRGGGVTEFNAGK